jgi:dihydrofolate reductase
VRAESGRLYLYNRETWEYMAKRDNTYKFVVVTENDDPETLKQMQKLVNDDIEVKG